jgi:hypothetical protein
VLSEIRHVSRQFLDSLSSPTKKVEMYTRNVSIQLKANCAPEFTRTLENEVIPMLRKQKGFSGEITLVPHRAE